MESAGCRQCGYAAERNYCAECGAPLRPAGRTVRASKVVLARDGNKTTLTMSNDYSGKASEFAIVIPVPVVPKQEQIRVVNSSQIDRVDQYTIPRMAEYYDPDPCMVYDYPMASAEGSGGGPRRSM